MLRALTAGLAGRMRTSRISQDTTRIFNALSPNSRSKRNTRSAAKSIATFALGYDGSVEVKQEHQADTLDSTPSAAASDIEDIGSPVPSSRKRKRPSPSGTTLVKTEHHSTWTSPRKSRKTNIKEEDEDEDEYKSASEDQDTASTDPSSRKSQPKLPAKRSTSPSGTIRYTPPSNWSTIYSLVQSYREANPVAPVDTMGCEDLFWQAAPPADQRYHTLTALMLSSQTKDTVTAAAMQRLHTELIPNPLCDPATGKVTASTLTIPNILAATPTHLNSLISKVGFHNTKTTNIQRVARILADQYQFDIPDTIEGLISLPGVGPKMAYLCMSAAWGHDIGIGVDVHVHRITNLWRWHVTKTPEQTREWLEGWLPRDKWHHVNKMLVGLGQTVCLPVGRRCGECPLAGKRLCAGEIRGWKAKENTRKKVKVETSTGEVKVEKEIAVVKSEHGGLVEQRTVEIKEEVG